MFRRSAALAISSVLVLALMGAATAAPPEVEDTMTGFSILTPGQSGLRFTTHEADQLQTYASLADDDNITDAELSDYFHELQFGSTDAETEDEYQPAGRTDVTIYRNSSGVPQVYGDTDEALAWGIGYASAEDRLWQMDVFRHVARGMAAEFVGDSFLNSDRTARRDGYTDDELQQMFDDFDDRFGADGAKLQAMLQSYADGVSAFVDEILASGSYPIEYYNTGNLPSEWNVLDSMALTVFQTRSFGGGGGEEVTRAAQLRELQAMHGDELGEQIFSDILFRNDPDAYTTIPAEEGEFPNPLWGDTVDPKAVAIPDKVKAVARAIARSDKALRDAAARVGFQRLASNGIVVAGSQTVSGDPIHYGAPQVGYATPSFLYEIEGHSPSFDFAGPTVPGGGPSIVLGRTAHVAWMIPVGVGDMMDERVEKLCLPKKQRKKGKKVKRGTSWYKFEGKCRKMDVRTETINTADPSEDPIRMKVKRTVHGPVVATATVKGKPVAIAQERTTWMIEPDFQIAVMKWSKNTTVDEADFAAGVAVFPMAFNILYADSDSTAYYYGGRHALRADGVDPRLPSWGTGQWEWVGFMGEDARPRMVDPDQGWFVNWNNKPSVGWDSTASSTWGAAHRVRLLADGMEAHNGPFRMGDVVQVAATAATQDAYAVQLWPLMSGITASTDAEADVLAALQAWVAGGAHRTDADRDGNQDFGTAVAAWDSMLRNVLERTFGDELGTIDGWGFDAVDDAPHSNGSSYFFSFPDYMLNLLSGASDKYSRNYCDHIVSDPEENCAGVVQDAFTETVATLSEQLGADPGAWIWEADYISFDEFGGTSAADFPWQNRGTWNHIVELHD